LRRHEHLIVDGGTGLDAALAAIWVGIYRRSRFGGWKH
jgi:hypothetical protein